MDADRLGAFLDERRYAVLATSRPDGRAQAAPIAFSVADGAFLIASVAGPRVRNLRARPYASLVVVEGERETHRAVTVEGPVVLHEGDALHVSRARLDSAWVKRHGKAPDWAAALIELRPELLFSHDATLRRTLSAEHKVARGRG